jgi:hypothetical protein
MKLSVFTASHSIERIDYPLDSLIKQTHKDFEWIILLNGKAKKKKTALEKKLKKTKIDFKVEVVKKDTDKIGYLKKECCSLASGEILVELDHDDALREDCLEKVNEAYLKDETIDFVYSDDYYVETRNGKEEHVALFGPEIGWSKRTDEEGRVYNVGFTPSPFWSFIWYAPDHVRTWKKSFYDKIGGHNADLDVCDDHELLCRTYVQGKCFKIEEPLYFYYLHEEQTFRNEKNEKIQNFTLELHDFFIKDMVDKWCDDNALLKVDLCSAGNTPKNYTGVDKIKFNDGNVVFDLDDSDWPFANGSVGVFRAQDALEHLKNPINTMKEIHRCLADFGWALIEVPSTDGRGAFQDPTHVSFWNSNSFWYYTQKNTAAYIGAPVQFKDYRILNYYPNAWQEQHNILYTKANLIKLPPQDYIIPPGGRNI